MWSALMAAVASASAASASSGPSPGIFEASSLDRQLSSPAFRIDWMPGLLVSDAAPSSLIRQRRGRRQQPEQALARGSYRWEQHGSQIQLCCLAQLHSGAPGSNRGVRRGQRQLYVYALHARPKLPAPPSLSPSAASLHIRISNCSTNLSRSAERARWRVAKLCRRFGALCRAARRCNVRNYAAAYDVQHE